MIFRKCHDLINNVLRFKLRWYKQGNLRYKTIFFEYLMQIPIIEENKY